MTCESDLKVIKSEKIYINYDKHTSNDINWHKITDKRADAET